MKSFLVSFMLLLAIFYSCNQKDDQNNEIIKIKEKIVEQPIIQDTINPLKKDEIHLFSYARNFPTITDTFNFITELRNAFNLENAQYMEQKLNEKITAYKKIKLFGAQKELLLIEYDYIEGTSAAFPWKYQVIMTTKGELIKVLDGVRYEFLTIFENKAPFLLVLTTTSKGNGSHQLYKFSNDTLENVLDQGTYFPRTYDAHSDYHLNKPNELNLKVLDENKDGFVDLIFSGKIIYNSDGNNVSDDSRNNKSIPVKLIFTYVEKTGHFEEFEDYSKKYSEYSSF